MAYSESRATYLTPRQLEILKLRRQGYATEKIAEIIGTTRQNVSILEKRGRSNIERAIRTIKAVKEGEVSTILEITQPVHILDAVKEIIQVADRSGIKLKDNLINIMVRLKAYAESDLMGGTIRRSVTVMMYQDGTIQFL
ncbi:MAG: Tfx family DNA-binding protein [Candidatus Thermoplasmatota archaeon]|jgi:Tfx family DNA-binding protein|nr:Tfx family DNA-binding protein [Candidatus Thermoplasmatota archaeon]MCL5794452.1 Tfx family DNA-binding protein [Candidatus Thermoplasmatota archaeon]